MPRWLAELLLSLVALLAPQYAAVLVDQPAIDAQAAVMVAYAAAAAETPLPPAPAKAIAAKPAAVANHPSDLPPTAASKPVPISVPAAPKVQAAPRSYCSGGSCGVGRVRFRRR